MGKYSMDLGIKDLPSKESYVRDPRFWTLPFGGNNSGSAFKATIRFIVDYAYSKKAMIKTLNHNFMVGAHTYNSICRKTIQGNSCPLCDLASRYYASNDPAEKELAKKIYAKPKFISNVYIISDLNNEKNTGKVLLFSFGKQIYDIIARAMNGDPDSGENPIEIFDPYEGANFIVRKESKIQSPPSYTSSKFLSPSKLKPTDEEIGAILSNTINLDTFIDPSAMPTLDDVEAFLRNFEGKSNIQDIVETNQINAKESDVESTTKDLDDILNS